MNHDNGTTGAGQHPGKDAIGPRLGDEVNLGPVIGLSDAVPESKPYNPEKEREVARGKLALILVWLASLLAVGVVVLSGLLVRPFDKELVAQLVSGIFGPIVALVGTVMGFYFGQSGHNK